MDQSKRKRPERFSFLLNGIIFIFGGLILFHDGKTILGIIQLVTGFSNLVMLRLHTERTRRFVNRIILILNILVAISVSADYFITGKKYLQYVWIAVAAISLVSLIIDFRRRKPEAALKLAELPGGTNEN
jgi:hypothetical protein